MDDILHSELFINVHQRRGICICSRGLVLRCVHAVYTRSQTADIAGSRAERECTAVVGSIHRVDVGRRELSVTFRKMDKTGEKGVSPKEECGYAKTFYLEMSSH